MKQMKSKLLLLSTMTTLFIHYFLFIYLFFEARKVAGAVIRHKGQVHLCVISVAVTTDFKVTHDIVKIGLLINESE